MLYFQFIFKLFLYFEYIVSLYLGNSKADQEYKKDPTETALMRKFWEEVEIL